ncbi:MAG: fibronectin type III domain-containing protein [Acutalibacteraceae bacterium]
MRGGVIGYRIYYRTSTKAAWKVGKSATTATSHTFSGLKPNQAFQFAVRPYIISDSGVVWSDYTTIIASTTPAAPVAKVSSPSKGKITLTWNAVSGATGYQVYYKSGNGSWKLYKTVAKPATYNFKNLKSGTKYTFAVIAYRTVSGTNFRSGYKAVSVTVK